MEGEDVIEIEDSPLIVEPSVTVSYYSLSSPSFFWRLTIILFFLESAAIMVSLKFYY